MSIHLDILCPECSSPMVASEGLEEGEAYCSQCDYREPFDCGWTDLDESYWGKGFPDLNRVSFAILMNPECMGSIAQAAGTNIMSKPLNLNPIKALDACFSDLNSACVCLHGLDKIPGDVGILIAGFKERIRSIRSDVYKLMEAMETKE